MGTYDPAAAMEQFKSSTGFFNLFLTASQIGNDTKEKRKRKLVLVDNFSLLTWFCYKLLEMVLKLSGWCSAYIYIWEEC